MNPEEHVKEAKIGDRVRLTYGDGSSVEGVLREVLELDDGTLHTHTRGQVRRDVIVCAHDWMQFGGAGDEWHECFLCGEVQDR